MSSLIRKMNEYDDLKKKITKIYDRIERKSRIFVRYLPTWVAV